MEVQQEYDLIQREYSAVQECANIFGQRWPEPDDPETIKSLYQLREMAEDAEMMLDDRIGELEDQGAK